MADRTRIEGDFLRPKWRGLGQPIRQTSLTGLS